MLLVYARFVRRTGVGRCLRREDHDRNQTVSSRSSVCRTEDEGETVVNVRVLAPGGLLLALS